MPSAKHSSIIGLVFHCLASLISSQEVPLHYNNYTYNTDFMDLYLCPSWIPILVNSNNVVWLAFSYVMLSLTFSFIVEKFLARFYVLMSCNVWRLNCYK